MKANRAYELIVSRGGPRAGVHGRPRRIDRIEVVSIDDGEVVLYWELPAKDAAKLLRLLRDGPRQPRRRRVHPHLGRPRPRGPVLSARPRGDPTVQEPTAAERAVARRAAESRATVPDLELRRRGRHGRVPRAIAPRTARSLTAMLARACALALRAVPRANGAYRDGRFELYSRVNIGIALADEDTYLIPTVFDADRKRLPSFGRDRAADRGRARRRARTARVLGRDVHTRPTSASSAWRRLGDRRSTRRRPLRWPRARSAAAGRARRCGGCRRRDGDDAGLRPPDPVRRPGRAVPAASHQLTALSDMEQRRKAGRLAPT